MKKLLIILACITLTFSCDSGYQEKKADYEKHIKNGCLTFDEAMDYFYNEPLDTSDITSRVFIIKDGDSYYKMFVAKSTSKGFLSIVPIDSTEIK